MSTGKKKKKKIIKYRRHNKINVGIIIFIIIFLYIVFSVYSYKGRPSIKYYEVPKGNIMRENSYNGFIIRSEESVMGDSSGYVHFYVPSTKRAAKSSPVYTIDETGSFEKYMMEHPEIVNEPGEEELSDLRYRLSYFTYNFRNNDFSITYDTRYSLDAFSLNYSGFSDISKLDDLFKGTDAQFVSGIAPCAGVISYTVDGYEGYTADDISDECFDLKNYRKQIVKPGELVESGSPVYKIVNSENWDIIFPLSEDEMKEYRDLTDINISFVDKDISVRGKISIFTSKNGKHYGKISLNELMENFIDERFVKFEIVQDDYNGLKIPKTSVTEKEFYIVPVDFITEDEEGHRGFYKRTIDEGKAEASDVFVEQSIYRVEDNFAYINIKNIDDDDDKEKDKVKEETLKPGDFIVNKGTNRNYQLSVVKELPGVYNINKGYAVFKQIIPVEENNEYIIVKENTDYGISVYDHIVLDSEGVSEGEIIY